MDENLKNVINNFLIKEFPVKRIKTKNKWGRALIIYGFFTKNKTYHLSQKTSLIQYAIIADLIQISSDFFGLNPKIVEPLVIKYVSNLNI